MHFVPESGERKLPDPLYTLDGDRVAAVEQWRQKRRPEIVELYRTFVFGREPLQRPSTLHFHVETTPGMMNGAAVRKQVEIRYEGSGGEGSIKLLLFIPTNRTKPSPLFLLINNRGLEHMDPERENVSPFWPAETILSQGFAAAVFNNADVDPDEHDDFQNGVHGIFDSKSEGRSPDAWGTIAAWAWGACRVMDYLETDSDIDSADVTLVGHSRGGKTALWAGAIDERFARVISNNSGCTGAALARGKKGETIGQINEKFPHWFNENYKWFKDREYELPFDQHMLLALMAPRPVYVTSATEDLWADPESEFLSLVYAEPVYKLYGLEGLGIKRMPLPDSPMHSRAMGYHLRTGKHDMTEYDWLQFITFASTSQ
ncbi:alpha/beta hydrolase [Paenibacillus cremeus]|uniref:Alpha/beta hydrolase n=2 Tax=Paenibacillus cremeus TaxID=2163881 RepID=A0A559K3K2_9BACL|nr:alpha/beta hydrolase [Paenibacillus cremeus]